MSKRHKQESKLEGGLAKVQIFVGSPFSFRKVGDNGIEMCDQWQHLADPFIANELCNFGAVRQNHSITPKLSFI